MWSFTPHIPNPATNASFTRGNSLISDSAISCKRTFSPKGAQSDSTLIILKDQFVSRTYTEEPKNLTRYSDPPFAADCNLLLQDTPPTLT